MKLLILIKLTLITFTNCSSLFSFLNNGNDFGLSENNSNKIVFPSKFDFLANLRNNDEQILNDDQSNNDNINNEEESNHNNEESDNTDYTGDSSIFGFTGETFFEFANRRVNEMKNQNKIQFENSISSCVYSPNNQMRKRYLSESSLNESSIRRCVLGSFNLPNNLGKTSDRLFMNDPFTLGLISSSDSSLRLFNLNVNTRTLNHLRTKHFHNEVPVDACSDKFKSIYIVFPDQNKIAKYQIFQTMASSKSGLHTTRMNKTRMGIKEIISIKDADFYPSAIACHDDLIYVSERPKNQIRVYDKQLRMLRIIYLNGVIVSSHHAISINQNVRVVLDGLDAISLFNPNLNKNLNDKTDVKKKYSLLPENNRVNLCHFYKKLNCLSDLHVKAESKSKSYIYLVDSCDSNILEFLYNKDERIRLKRRIHLPIGTPVSVTANQFGYLFVLTDNPRKIFMIDAKDCNGS